MEGAEANNDDDVDDEGEGDDVGDIYTLLEGQHSSLVTSKERITRITRITRMQEVYGRE